MASSTTKPEAMTRAMSVRLFSEKLARYMTPSVPTRERGTASAGMSVALALRKKTQMTAMTRTTASTSSNCTSATVARMVAVLSVMTSSCTEFGSEAASMGRRALMASATAMTLAPGWRCTEMMMA